MGYFAIPFDDYGTDEHRRGEPRLIQRYRLEKKDPDAAVSEPVKPIVFYLSPEVPDEWRPYIKQAVEDLARCSRRPASATPSSRAMRRPRKRTRTGIRRTCAIT